MDDEEEWSPKESEDDDVTSVTSEPDGLQCVFANCDRVFDKKWRLKEHIASHTGDRPYICEEPGCEKSFIRKAHLARHSVSHSEDRPFTCPTCPSSFKSPSNLRKHERLHEGRKPYQCTAVECGEAFLKKTQLYGHLKTCHGISSPFTCDVCSASFSNKSHLNRHTKNQHLSRFMCTECSEVFEKFSVLQKHISKVHKNRAYCARCSMVFKNRATLSTHIARVHSVVGEQEGPSSKAVEVSTEVVTPRDVVKTEKYEVSEYNAVCNPGELSDTIFSEDSKPIIPKFECPICHQTHGNKASLTRHMKLIHNTLNLTEYKCSECQRVFKHKPNLVKHIQSKHKGIKRFKCDLCPMAFFYKHAFERHTRAIHQTEDKEKRIAWNKTTLEEDISGHFTDKRVERYVEKMRDINTLDMKTPEIPTTLDQDLISEAESIEVSGS